MKVLVCGTGMVAEATVDGLLERGHTVRLASPTAGLDSRAWRTGVEAFEVDLGNGHGTGAAEGCGALVLLPESASAGASLDAAEASARVARRILGEADRSTVRRIVVLSSTAADGDTRRFESIVLGREAATVVRAGVVYGPGDGLVALLLRLVRTLPVIPLPGGGSTRVQPLWYADLGHALSAAVERADLAGEVLDVAGPEVATVAEIVDRLCVLTHRAPARIALPRVVTALGLEAVLAAGGRLPVTEAERALFERDAVLPEGRPNALASILGIEPTMLEDGLAMLVRETPEQPPLRGRGPVIERRHFADIEHPRLRVRELRDEFRRRAVEVLELEEPRPEPGTALKKGSEIWLSAPARGRIGLRVLDVRPDRITLAALEGHPLAAVVSFVFLERGTAMRFEVLVHARAKGALDSLMPEPIARVVQDADWSGVVRRFMHLSGGEAPDGVQVRTRTLDPTEAAEVMARAERLVLGQRRAKKGPATSKPRPPAPSAV